MALKKSALIGIVAAVLVVAVIVAAVVLSTKPAPVAAAPTPAATGVIQFNLTPEQNRVRAEKDPAAIALIPAKFPFATPGKLTVAVSPWAPPLAAYATDDKTVIGSEPDLAQLVADSLGLELVLVPVAWEDWPLGVQSGKYDAIFSNVTVTEERKELFDFASYRQDVLGFYVKSDSPITAIKEAKDIAGLKIIVGSGTNQEKIVLGWDADNKTKGLKPAEFQYFDNDAASDLAIQSGRADVTFGPNDSAAYKAATNGQTKLVGIVNGGWPLKADIAVGTKKGNGIAAAYVQALNDLIASGKYDEVLKRWGVESDRVEKSELNPPGLPKPPKK
jgi:polar amino acid transport system substrate-binding protein